MNLLVVCICLALTACVAADKETRPNTFAEAWKRRQSRGSSASFFASSPAARRHPGVGGSGGPTGFPVFNVMDYGAKGDAKTDNTNAFQQALNAANSSGGGEVYVPAGQYLFTGSITLEYGVTLLGSYATVPSHQWGGDLIGSVLMPTAGRGSDNGTAFITINGDATVEGFTIIYPDQVRTAAPVPYPYTIDMVAANSAVVDVELLNSWNGIRAVGAHRHRITRIQGQPINIGIFVDETYDIGRIEDVHFNPWYSNDLSYVEWQMTHGRAFVFGRSDWEYVFNTFAFGYAVGYHFVQTPTGEMNGNFLGLGADYACNASVLVDASQPAGLLITNGEFTSFHNKDFAPKSTADSTQVVVSATNTGPVQFVNTAFWGPSDHIARLYGTGTTTFSACTFVQWDLMYHNGSAAIELYDGNLILTSSNFQQVGKQVEIFATAKKAVVTGNIFEGGVNVVNHGVKDVQIGLNA
eukprot:m.147901 g.147901  ORF g.147901 m.147901 type:complete len:467 (-) comp20583_c0_seq5:166-1566(-)